jgi:hypothetical protein
LGRATTEDETHEAVEAIETAFTRQCFKKDRNTWEWLHLKSCTAISEEDFPVARAKQLQALPLDYLSLRADPPAPTALGVVSL